MLFNKVSFGHNPSGTFAQASGSISCFSNGTPSDLSELGFQVVNFNEFFTPGRLRPGPAFGHPPQVADPPPRRLAHPR